MGAMLYGGPAWQNVNETDIEKLNTAERKVLRGMTGLYRKEKGHYYKNEELYKAAEIKEKAGDLLGKHHIKHLKKRIDHKISGSLTELRC